MKTTGKRTDKRSSANREDSYGASVHMETLEPRLLLSITTTGIPDWVEQGPGLITNGQVDIGANDPVVGAIETIAAHPTDPDIAYMGAVNGGLWKTTNATNVNPSWTPLDDQLSSLAIGSIAFSPLDATNNTLFAGTGRFSNGFRGGSADGLYRTTDGGATWTPLGLAALGGNRIRSVVPTSITETAQVLLVAMVDNGGVMRSNDGGVSWVGVTGLPAGSATDLIGDPNNVNRFYAALPGQGVYQSVDGGVNWAAVNTGIAGLAGSTNIELSAHDAGATTVLYAGVLDANQQLSGVFRSADNGANWAVIGAAPNIHPGGQGFNNFSILADFSISTIVYVGGDRATASPWVGNLFLGDSAGGTWTAITKAGANNSAPHADSRSMVFDANGNILEGDDGGIYRLTNPSAGARVWTAVFGAAATLRPTEFYSIAYDTINDIIFGGTQDVGSPEQTATGSFTWDDIHQADGNTQAVDNSGANSIRYSMSNNFGTFLRRTFDNTNSQVGGDVSILLADGVGGGAKSGLNATDQAFSGFTIIPYVLNAIDPTRMLIGLNGMYESTDQGDNVTDITIAGQNGYTAFAYGGTSGGIDNEEVIYAAVNGNLFLRTAAAGAFGQLVAYPGGAIRDIVLDPTDWRTAYVIDSNQVFMTDDAGVTWDDITDNLTDFTTSLRTIELYTGAGTDALLVGGSFGVFSTSLDGSATQVWSEYGKGLPTTVVSDIRYYSADDILVVGTFGRGAWTVANVSSSINTDGILDIDGTAGDDTIRLILNASNPAFVDIFINNLTTTPDGTFELSELLSINIDGLAGNDNIIIDSTNGLIEVTDGINVEGGAGFDTLTLQQTGGATHTSDTYSVGAEAGAGTSTIVGATLTQTVFFQGLEPVVDTVAAASLTVNATAADNAIEYGVGSVVANGMITIDEHESIEFSNKTALVINGDAGSDEIELNNPNTPTSLTSITVNGGDPVASDTLVIVGTSGTDTIAFTPTAGDGGTVAITGAPSVTFATTESVVIDGQGGNDVLTVNGTAGADTITVTPGAAVDSGQVLINSLVAMSFEELGSTGTVTIAGAGGTDTLVYNGSGANDTFSVAAATGTVDLVDLAGNHVDVLQSGVENLTLNGLAGDDTFNVTGAQPYTTISLQGGEPSASDVANLTGDGTAVVANVGDASPTVTGGGLGTVNLSGVEVLNLDAATGDLTINGTAGDDSADVTPLGVSSGKAQINDETPVVNFSNTGTLTIDLAGGIDELTVNGTAGADSITVAGGTVTVVDAGPITREPINYSNIEALTVNSLGGDDTIDVTPSATVPISVDGGDPVGNTAGDTLIVQAGGASATYEPGPQNDEGSVLVAATERVSFDHIEALSIAGASSAVINGTNGDDSITIIARDDSTHAALVGLTPGVNDFTSSVNAGMEILWIDTPAVTINALSGSDEIAIHAPAPNAAVWDVDVTVNGGVPSASDRLVIETPGTDSATYTPTTSEDGTLVIAGLNVTVTINQIEELVYDGEAGDDTLTIVGSGAAFVYRPGQTVDAGSFAVDSLLAIEFTNLGSSGALVVSTGGAADGDSLVLEGTAFDDTFTVTSTTAQINSQLTITHDLVASETVELRGGDPSSDSDAATVTGTAGSDTIGLAVEAQTVTGLGPVINLVGIEDLTIAGGGGVDTVNVTEMGETSDLQEVDINLAGASDVNVTASADDDTISVTPNGAGTGEITSNDIGPVVDYTGVGGTLTINGGSAGFNVLEIFGTEGADTVGSVATSQVTVNGSAVTLGSNLDRLDVLTLGGADTVDLSNITTGIPTVITAGDGDDTVTGTPGVDLIKGGLGNDTLSGGAGADTLFGGQGDDTLSGGAGVDILSGEQGDDTLTGGTGNDTLLGGDNSDSIIWADGDGSDLIEGGDGDDELTVTTDVASGDTLTLSRNGRRVDLSRTNLTAFTLDIAQVEQLDLNTSGGGDTVTVNDLTDTDLLLVNLDVGSGDAATDSVTINGTTGPDVVEIAMDGSIVDVKGLPARIRLANTSTGDSDSLTVNGNAGNDSIKSEFPVESSVDITLNGGDGDDYLSADAILNGGAGDDVLVSGAGNDTINGGAGIDRVVARGNGDINFVLTDTSLTGLATTGTATGTDVLTSIEEAELEGGTLANTFTIGAFSGHVMLSGGQGSDTINLSTSPTAVTIDMDMTDFDQAINNSGLTLRMNDTIENITSSPFNDKIFMDALFVPRAVDGGLPNVPHVPGNPPIPPGDKLTVDGRHEFVTVIRTDVDSGTATAFGYQAITFDNIEKLAIVNTIGSTGMGELDLQAYTSSVRYPTSPLTGRKGRRKPRAVVVGDVNGDGWQDLVGVNSKRFSTISVLLGNGDGTFGAPTEYLTGARNSWDLELADLDGDGDLDVVTVNMRSKTISVMLGDGAGAFGAGTLYATGTRKTGKKPIALELGDLNGDGDIDVVVANYRSKTVAVLMNDGTSIMGVATTYATGGRKTQDVELVDVDRDGDLDILTSNKGSRNISVLLNGGAGLFGAAATFAGGKRMSSIVATDNNGNYLDFNLDGNPDVAVSNLRGNYTSIFLGDGAGSFTTQLQAKYSNKYAYSIAAGDVNSDGKVDLVIAHNVGNFITILLGNGNGTFSEPFEFNVGNVVRRQINGVILADLNNDGGIDIAAANIGTNDISVLLRNLVV